MKGVKKLIMKGVDNSVYYKPLRDRLSLLISVGFHSAEYEYEYAYGYD